MIDVQGTLARLGDDRELLRETAQFVVEDVPRLLDETERRLHDGDIEATARAIHSLKGLALNFGADEAVEAAEAVESAVREADVSAAGISLVNLRSRFDQLTSAVKREVLGEVDSGQPAFQRWQ